MAVMRTDEWLEDSYNYPIGVCEKLRGYFNGVSAKEIYEYLTMYGMYRPTKKGRELVTSLRNQNIWEMIGREHQLLQKMWNGPDIPIFIFPLNTSTPSEQLNEGKSGLAFEDKLFLFVTDRISEKEIKALFTHEYNHVCRLTKLDKREEDYLLLDTIILEGLAENAVCERFGENYTANWTSLYSNEKLSDMWRNLIFPNKQIPKSAYEHQELLYGGGLYPDMTGYSVGYYIVKNYMETTFSSTADLLTISSDTIAKTAQS